MHAFVNTPGEAVDYAMKQARAGLRCAPRGTPCDEVRDFTVTIMEPATWPIVVPGRRVIDAIGVLEGLQLIGQTTRPELMSRKFAAFEKYKDAGIFHGAYGIRIYDQLRGLVDLLKTDPDTRQAVLSIYDSPKDLLHNSKDIPCTLTVQFFFRSQRLHMRVSMRSNDVWLGMPYDLMQFGMLQTAVAKALNVPVGEYTHTVGSLHFYVHDQDKYQTPIAVEPHQMKFSGSDISTISYTCRRILDGWESSDMSYFEKWCYGRVWDA